MWIDHRLPALRRRKLFGYSAAAVLVLLAVLARVALPGLPPFLTLFPAIVLSAFLGGRYAGIVALVASTIAAGVFFLPSNNAPSPEVSNSVSLVGFVIVGALTIFIVDLLDVAVNRLRRERERVQLALRAAGAAAWEWTLPNDLKWDRNFYELLGINPETNPPSPELFLSRVHPADRNRLNTSTTAIREGKDPPPSDEFRIIRPDGQTVWLEHHRAIVVDEQRHVLGITQDITRRKETERQIRELMRELAHRVKNQYAVIMAMVRETTKQTISPEEFETVVQARIAGLAKSHDLLVNGEWKGATIGELLYTQVEPFGSADRCDVSGPRVALNPTAVQYLGMAFHELATNSAKHGALSVPEGKVTVSWSVKTSTEDQEPRLSIKWKEIGGPPVQETVRQGFGRQVLERLAPAALEGRSRLSFDSQGIEWSLEASGNSIAVF